MAGLHHHLRASRLATREVPSRTKFVDSSTQQGVRASHYRANLVHIDWLQPCNRIQGQAYHVRTNPSHDAVSLQADGPTTSNTSKPTVRCNGPLWPSMDNLPSCMLNVHYKQYVDSEHKKINATLHHTLNPIRGSHTISARTISTMRYLGPS